MEMLDRSLLVTTFSRQIWPLHNSATRVTSMESPSKEIRRILPCSVHAKRRTQKIALPYRYGGASVQRKAASPAKSAGEAFSNGPGRRLELRPVLIFRPIKGNDRFRRKPRAGQKMPRESCFAGGSSGL